MKVARHRLSIDSPRSQAAEYEKAHSIQLQQFFDSSLPKIQHPEVRAWGEDLLKQRDDVLPSLPQDKNM